MIVRSAATVAQVLAVLAVLVGLFLLLPTGWFLVSAGVVVLGLATLVEAAAMRPDRGDR